MDSFIIAILDAVAEDVFARCLRGESTTGQVLTAYRFQQWLRAQRGLS